MAVWRGTAVPKPHEAAQAGAEDDDLVGDNEVHANSNVRHPVYADSRSPGPSWWCTSIAAPMTAATRGSRSSVVMPAVTCSP
jgi:hypothetical protein